MGTSRTIITISDEERRWLSAFTRAHRISLAEGVRRGIACLKASEGSKNYQEIIKVTRGLWKKGDSLAYQKQLRSEWDSH